MADGNVGTLYYEVEARTAGLVEGERKASESLDRLEKNMKNNEAAAKRVEPQMKKTSAAIKGIGKSSKEAADSLKFVIDLMKVVVSIKTAAAIIEMADSYNEMTERVRMATRAGVDLNKVNDRLLETANRTYRPLSEAAEVYIRAGAALSSMGKSTSEVLDVTDSLSFLFVKNATSADRADSAISAFTASVNTGKVSAMAWNTILAATPTIVEDIAAASGKTDAEIRKLGVTGKLTADQLVTGLQKSLDSNREAADNMATTFGDALQAVRNNLTVLVGKVNQASGATGGLSEAIEKVAESINQISVSQIVREFDAFNATVKVLDSRITAFFDAMDGKADWLRGSVSQSFSELALNTAREVDGITNFFMGSVAAIGTMYDVLTDNIANYFSNAWNKIKGGAAGFVNDLSDILNKPLQAIGLEGFGKVDFGTAPMKEIKKLGVEVRRAWDEAANSAGLYDDILKDLSDRQIYRSIEEWQDEYKETTAETVAEVQNLTEETDKLTAAQKQMRAAMESNEKALQDIRTAIRLAELSGEELFIEQNKLKLNQYATPEQIAELEALSAVLYRVNEQQKLAQKVGDDPSKYIRGDVDPLSGGAFDDQAARYDAEAVKEQERYEASLVRLREAMEAKKLTMEQNQTEFEYLQEQHNGRMDQIDSARASVMYDTYSNAFGSIADVLKRSEGEQTGIYKAMFAASKAFSVASATIKAYDAISTAWASGPFPTNLAAVAATTPQVMSVVSAIQGTNYGGGRMYGGGVNPNSMYRVNEGGAPEILNTADGKQYLMPNTRGEVVSNKDATAGGGGAPKVTVNLIEDASKAGQVNTDYNDEGTIVSVVVANIMGDGAIADSMGMKFGLQGRGQ